jgi:hypothetical protein
MREKARFVLGAMEQRMTAFGFGWAGVTATQVYTIFDIHPLLPDEILRRRASPGRLDLAFRAPAGAGSRFRDGRARRRPRISDLTRQGTHAKEEEVLRPAIEARLYVVRAKPMVAVTIANTNAITASLITCQPVSRDCSTWFGQALWP